MPRPSSKRFCTAIAWVGEPEHAQPIAPLLAWRYLAYILLAILSGLMISEGVLRYATSQRLVVSSGWIDENAAIVTMGMQKNLASPADPIWRSTGMPFTPNAPGLKRILVLGDSFVWGDGYLNANDIWWRQLERELRHRGYHGVEVIAAGLNGVSTQDQVAWLTNPSFLASIQADCVIMGYVTNDPDLRDAEGNALVKQIGRDVHFPSWQGLDETLGRFAPTLVAQLKSRLTAKWASHVDDAYEYGEWELKLVEAENLEAYIEVIQRLGRLVHQAGLPFLVVTLPNRPDLETFQRRFQPVAPVFAAANLPFYDTTNRFADEYANDASPLGSSQLRWGINPANGHPSQITTRFYARAVADILERDFPIVLGERTTQTPLLKPRINDWMPPSATVSQVEQNVWRLTIPSPPMLMPRMPIGEPHLMLAFELPVAIQEVRLQGGSLQGGRLWWTLVDPVTGVDNDNPVGGEMRTGSDLRWILGGGGPRQNINTLRISAQVEQPQPEIAIAVERDQIIPVKGNAFAFSRLDWREQVPEVTQVPDLAWVMVEDGVVLGPADATPERVIHIGRGLWSHREDRVVFSTSDNSNPTKNGRRYELARFAPGVREILLEIEFAEDAVRP